MKLSLPLSSGCQVSLYWCRLVTQSLFKDGTFDHKKGNIAQHVWHYKIVNRHL